MIDYILYLGMIILPMLMLVVLPLLMLTALFYSLIILIAIRLGYIEADEELTAFTYKIFPKWGKK